MKNTTLSTLIIGSLFFFSCGEAKETPDKETETKECVLSLDAESVSVSWMAYKYTEPTGVGGIFDSIAVSGSSESKEITEAVINTQFEIYTASVNSSNKERDVKITNHFYGNMENEAVISGSISSVSKDGNGAVLLSMNGQKNTVPFTWEMDDENVFHLTTTINVPDWGAQSSLDSLNTVCYDLHKGEDGVSVLWPNVDVKVAAPFKQICE